jgi:hypothetical protein
MKNRLEDLGKLSILLRYLFDHEIFDIFDETRSKDACEWFTALSDDRKMEIIHALAYGLSDLKDKVAECFVIADGEE